MVALAQANEKKEKNTLAKQRLQEIIAQKSFKKGDFTLASGLKSDHFFDLKPTLLDPEGANLVADLVLERIEDDIDAVGGLELGACPIVSSVCVRSFQTGRNIGCFYVRKAKKERGTEQLIEGYTLNPDDRVVVVEDVTTKGGSSKNAVEAVQQCGAKVVKVISIVDRLQGAQENLNQDGIVLESIFTKTDFM